MKEHRIPGASIVLIEQNSIRDVLSFGEVAQGSGQMVTSETGFQFASISKAVAAVVALAVHEAGILHLDADLSDIMAEAIPTLKAPAPPYHLTVRRILSHSGGFLVHGVPGFDPSVPIPTLDQIISGIQPAANQRFRMNYPPGMGYKYSGAGYAILERVLSHVTTQPFHRLAEQLVLSKLRMGSTTFAQVLPQNLFESLAFGHDEARVPIRGKAHVFPASAAAGLVSTAKDIAQFVIGLNDAATSIEGGVISNAMALEMLTPQLTNPFGLGVRLSEPKQARNNFFHGGNHFGFEALMTGSTKHGSGYVIAANVDTKLDFCRRVASTIQRFRSRAGVSAQVRSD